MVAYVLHVGALTLAAMSLVQAVLAGGLVVLAVVAERFFGFELERRQWMGLVLTAAGLAMLAVTGEARSGQESGRLPDRHDARLRGGAGRGGGGADRLVQPGAAPRSHHGLLLGLAAGLLFTSTHVAVKAVSGKIDTGIAEIVLSPYLYVAIAGGVVAFFASARSLQIGPAVPVIAVTAIAGNASAIPAGIVVFGDPLGSDALDGDRPGRGLPARGGGGRADPRAHAGGGRAEARARAAAAQAGNAPARGARARRGGLAARKALVAEWLSLMFISGSAGNVRNDDP